MRGSGVREGAEPDLSVGDLIPIETEYGKIYKIIVYRGTPAMYTTACFPEVAKRIHEYFKYRMNCGDACKQYDGKEDHVHECDDGYEIIQKRYRADEKHLDTDAPVIREEFDRKDSLKAMHPKRIKPGQMGDIVRNAAIAAER